MYEKMEEEFEKGSSGTVWCAFYIKY